MGEWGVGWEGGTVMGERKKGRLGCWEGGRKERVAGLVLSGEKWGVTAHRSNGVEEVVGSRTKP